MTSAFSFYDDEEGLRRAVVNGEHRSVIGGFWEEIGQLQFDWLVGNGLKPNNNLLDIGCGSGRLAVKAVPYLEPFRYFGQDISAALIYAAQRELENAGQVLKVSSKSFCVSADFEAPGQVKFDFVMAQSVFTHMPLHRLSDCLNALKPRVSKDAKFFVTFFIVPESTVEFKHNPGGVISYADKDPFHTNQNAVIECAARCGWTGTFIGDWAHPRDQKMFLFTPDGH